MASPQATEMLEEALNRRGIEYETHEFIGVRYLVFAQQQMTQVRSVLLDTFGYTMVQGPPLDGTAKRMGCNDEW